MLAGAATLGRFALVGLLNTGVGFGVILSGLWLGLGDIVANTLGYAVGLAIGFTVNRGWTFRAAGRANLREVGRYGLAFALAWSANLAVLMTGLRAGHSGSPLLHLAGVAVYSGMFFLLSRHFVFRAAASPEAQCRSR